MIKVDPSIPRTQDLLYCGYNLPKNVVEESKLLDGEVKVKYSKNKIIIEKD
jgi:hypothetical protein|tara:strand:+ start:1339 stop:1491 length:153 start_codon:yes stop_codon:yes gene_type:complete